MYVQVRTVDGKSSITVTVSKLTTVEELRRLVADKLKVQKERQRFFYRGKQLEDCYRLFDYDIRLNDVIQLMFKSDVTTERSSSTSWSEQVQLTVSSKYFRIGDEVDVRHISYGAWFEGKIVGFASKRNDQKFTAVEKSSHSQDCKMEDKAKNSESIMHTDISNVSKDMNGKSVNLVDSKFLYPNSKFEDDFLYEVSVEDCDLLLQVTLEHVRPRARCILNLDELKIGDVVMANYNIEDPEARGYWYDVCITTINKTRTSPGIIGCIYTGKNGRLLENCKIKFFEEIMRIENIKLVTERSSIPNEQTQADSSITHQYTPSCSRCNDSSHVKCRQCGCYVCGGKDNPATQILCDECNMAYHIKCLSPPLQSVPACDEWYCPTCKNDENEIVKAGERLKDSKKKAKLPCQNSKSNRDWGKGMACVGRTKECTLVPPNHYGTIPGVEVGTCWMFRVQVSESGVHRPPVGGIHGRESDGAYSIVLSGGYEDDIDDGDEFLYTGSGGRDLSGNKRTAEQSCNQTLTRLNKALALNCNIPLNNAGGEAVDWKGGKPVRVVRNYKLRKHSKYAPEIGNRYDGIYKVVKYYPEKGKSGFIIWRYLFRRDDDIPAPWTGAGKRHIELHGLEEPLVPDGYLEANEKRKEEGCNAKRRKTIQFELDHNIQKLIDEDVNTKLWRSCSEYLRDGKLAYITRVSETFMCVCCQELVFKPVTTSCEHNICKSCLQRSFSAKVYTCPFCRHNLGDKYDMKVNETLAAILTKLFPGYEHGR